MIKDFKNIVEKVLKEHPITRDDDFKLYVWICQEMCPEVMGDKFSVVLWNHLELGMPSYETITRARQALQHDKPELRGKKYAQRHKKQTDYIEAFGRRYS